MSNRILLLLSALLLAPLAMLRAEDAPKQAARPNILHILADDMGWNALSCYGNKDVATPHLDRLAAQGMRFTQAYADAQCSPTRAAFLSGQYGARTGVFKVLNEKEPSRALLRSPEANAALGPEVGHAGDDAAQSRLHHRHQREVAHREQRRRGAAAEA